MAGRLAQDVEPEIEWVHYPRLEPGVYSAYCHFARTYFDRNFNRWTCLLRFEVRSDDLLRVISPHIPFWLNLGSKEKPHATRRGKYFKEWVKANSGDGPTRRDRLAPHIFTRRMARVEIGDTKALAPYSVVQKIVSWDTSSGLAGHEVNKSHSQERHLSQPRKGSI
jgi:hypothetical protein